MNHLNTRRSFMKSVLLSVAALITAPAFKIRDVLAGEEKMVSETDALVKALAYVPNASASKDRKDKKQNCGNCQFYSAEPKAKVGKCQLIPTGLVSEAGWCRSYSPKPKKKA